MRVRVCVLSAVLFVTLLSVAQVNLGVITGTVRDKAGAVVAGATVSAKNVDTTFERTVFVADAALFPGQPIVIQGKQGGLGAAANNGNHDERRSCSSL